MRTIRLMSKWLVLTVFVLLLFLALEVASVSATHSYNYNYGGYGWNRFDCGYGYERYGNCYRTETFRDITENRRTTIKTTEDRFNRETVKTVTTTFIDTKRETRTPSFTYSRTSYPRRAFVGSRDYSGYSDIGFRRAFNQGYNYYDDTDYGYPPGYYGWGW